MEDSNEIRHEKLALERELNKLRPNIAHLEAQIQDLKGVRAQRDELERQVDSLELALEKEKHSKQRIQSKSEDNNEWKDRFHDTQKELERAKKEQQKAAKEYEGKLREANGENEQLSERLDDKTTKLKKTLSELKGVQEELKECRAQLEAAQKFSKGSTGQSKKNTRFNTQPANKRRANEMSLEDISIGTPGPDEATSKRPPKKRGVEYALVGEKSTFSITPFLSRTKEIAGDEADELSILQSPTSKGNEAPEIIFNDDDNAPLELDEPAGSMATKFDQASIEQEKASSVTMSKKSRGRPKKALDDAPSTKKNMPASSKTTSRSSKPKVNKKLEMVAEETEARGEEEEAAPEPMAAPVYVEPRLPSSSRPTLFATQDANTKKKKRKVLGGGSKTLFEDDDDHVTSRPAKVQLGAGRKLKANLGGVSNSFGGATFSPLKRDRRGVQASFLS